MELQNATSCPLRSCAEHYGVLPACAGLAVPYVPFQQEDPPKYDQGEALANGTLFPYLNLPFFRMMDASRLPSGPMTQLQALDFVTTELGIYLDTHPEDTEALRMFQRFTSLAEKARAQLEQDSGPLTRCAVTGDRYTWLTDPWPWNYEHNDEVK